MQVEPLPPQPPPGMKRYKVILKSNPFAVPSAWTRTKTADVDEKLTLEQVRELALKDAKEMGIPFTSLDLEVVA